MKRMMLLLVLAVVTFFVFSFWLMPGKRDVETNMTESFITTWMTNKNGTLATFLIDDASYDADLVKGKEALAESLGIWLLYAVEKQDRALFEESFSILEEFFLKEDGFVYWKLAESGRSEVSTNALVDDLRIIDALFQAYEKWGEDRYQKTGVKIGRYLNEFNTNRGTLTDYYDREHQYSSNVITLSYIEPLSMAAMKEQQLLNQDTFERTQDFLLKAPLKNGFYPKSYNVVNKSYTFDKEVHMVDQALTALNQVRAGLVETEFLTFIKAEIRQHGVIFGRYHRNTKEPAVRYESPAIYGFLVMYSLALGEEELAADLFERMQAFRNTNQLDRYYGGFSVSKGGNTHIFDNLVPLLAEQKYIQYFKE